MKPVHVHGMGLWTPGFADVGAWCDGKHDSAVSRPDANLLTGPFKRRASQSVSKKKLIRSGDGSK